ncbi:MAG: mitochondrial ribosomal L43 [Lasallia pustulata]|uniref:Large ribosomal subunit protein mL43 n=1 Tax=Lasallia pustulata TaxID=136370 RepID=A0A5M8PJE1_9LECA|nr:MAG: mitochondrial ribosomal L43 [Lasallia pustulata]
MPLKAIRTTSTGRNGVGAFILQCKRLEFHYCDWAGSSRGMNAFLTHLLPRFALSSPTIETHISPRPHAHPLIRAYYINGRTRAICVRNLEKEQVLQKAEMLRDASGEKNRKVRGGRVVASLNEGVRGVWDPFHGAGDAGRVLGRRGVGR